MASRPLGQVWPFHPPGAGAMCANWSYDSTPDEYDQFAQIALSLCRSAYVVRTGANSQRDAARRDAELVARTARVDRRVGESDRLEQHDALRQDLHSAHAANRDTPCPLNPPHGTDN